MKELYQKTYGVRGGSPSIKKVGAVSILHNDNTIFIDNYIGRGDNYKKRDNPLINITVDGKLIFSGDFDKLAEKLGN